MLIPTILLLWCSVQNEEPCGLEPTAAAQEEPNRPGQEELPRDEPKLAPSSAWRSQWFPSDVIYPNYLADPLTPRSGTKVMFPLRKKDDIKIENSLGSQRTLWQSISPSGDEGIDVSLEGAVISRFDLNEDWDLDAKWREETDWDWAVALQGGLWLVQDSPSSTAGLRVLAEYYRGRAAQTQFPNESNNYWALGFAAGF